MASNAITTSRKTSGKQRQERPVEISHRDVEYQTLRVAHWPVPGGSKHPPVLYFAGIGTRIEELYPLAEKWHDREIISFDMPGIGGSPQPFVPYTIANIAWMTSRLLKEFGIEQADVVGLSWGGAIAQQFAIQHSEQVRRVILQATSTGMLSVPGNMNALGRELSSGFVLPSMAGFSYQVMAMAGWSSVPFLPFLDKPVFIMMGTRDEVVPIANGHILRLLIPGAKLHKVKGGGHMFARTHLDQTVQEMNRFLDAE